MPTRTSSYAGSGIVPDGPSPASVAFGAGATSIALLAALHVIKPEVDPAWSPISAYALGAHGWVMTLAFFAWGVGAVALFAALRRSVRTRAGRIGLGFLLLGAAGPLLAAVFPMDPLTTPADAMTTAGSLHSLGAVLGDGFPIAGALLTWSLVRNDAAWARFKAPLLLATGLSWAGVIVLTLSMAIMLPENGQLGPDVTVGWQGRFMTVAMIGWLMTMAWSATKVARGAA